MGQSTPKVVELRCTDTCSGWTPEGGGGLECWRKDCLACGGLSRGKEKGNQIINIQSGPFGDSDEIGLVLRYTDMENYVALVTNMNERNVWTVIEVDGNKRKIVSSDSFEKAPEKREMFIFNFVHEGGKLSCTVESDSSKIKLACPEDSLKSQLPSPFCSARGDLRWNILGCYFPMLA